MRTNLNNQFKTKKGITLIALVVTIIVLLILAGISIQMLTGDNGILKRASEANERTGISQVLEEVKLVATEGMSNYYLGDEENIVTAVENAISTKVSGFKEFTSTRGTSPIQGIVTRNGKDYAFSVDANSGVVTSPEESDYQWRIVSDNDNDGVLSIGDEVAPLINSVKDEHFYVVSNNGNNVKLITKLAVDHNTNSQSSSAEGVPYDKAYCDLEGVEHDWIMPTDMIKTPESTELVEDSNDESGFSEITIPAVYYDGTEKGKVHCTGTYTKNYGLRLKQAGLNLMDFNSNSGCPYIGLPLWTNPLLGNWDTSDWIFYSPFSDILGDRLFWLDLYDTRVEKSGLVPYYSDNKGMDTDMYNASDVTLRLVIQVDFNLFNTANN